MDIQEVQAVVESTRQLARIVRVDKVLEHPNADALSLAIIGGWQCCIKLNEFKAGDLGLYVEIDSLVPTTHPAFTFLEARTSDLKLVNGKPYSRIKTIKLRKELSQGMLIQLPPEFAGGKEGDDLTEALGVLKKPEKTVKAESNINEETLLGKIARFISGPARTNLKPWPSFLDKSEQMRVQNMGGRWESLRAENKTYERTIKFNGQSLTIYSDLVQAGICSRNNEISLVDDKWDRITQLRFWLGQLLVTNRRMFRKRQWVKPAPKEDGSKYGIGEWITEFRNKNQANRLFTFPRWKTGIFATDDHLVRYCLLESRTMGLVQSYADKTQAGWAVQGELIGPGIQSNFEGVDAMKFYVYKVSCFSAGGGQTVRDLPPKEARAVIKDMGLDAILVIKEDAVLPETIKEILTMVEGPKIFTKKGQREGEVWKSNDGLISFKVISNKYLINEAEAEG